MLESNGGAWDDNLYLELKQELHAEPIIFETSSESTPANPPAKQHPELAPYHDSEYVHELLIADVTCCSRFALSCCYCFGSFGPILCLGLGAISTTWWIYNAVILYENPNDFQLEPFLIYIATGLCGLFLFISSIYILSIDTHKILALLLASFKQKLDLLDYVNSKLEITRENLDVTESNLSSQNDRLRKLVMTHEALIRENRSLHSQHNDLTDKYKRLIKEYDSAIVEQQKILSNTLGAVADLHQHGSEQIHDLLKEMSHVTNDNKEVCKDFGRNFLQVDKLKSELTDLRNNLNTSISDLHVATRTNHDLADKLTALTKMLPQLITNQNSVNRRHIIHERKAEDLGHLLRDIVADSSDKPRASTLPNQGSTERKILEMSLSPLKEKQKRSFGSRKVRRSFRERAI